MTERSCGSCTACCYVMEIEAIKKPNRTPCPNQCDEGCGIYKNKPTECTDFNCSWLSGVVSAEQHRADLVNLVVWPMPEGSWPDKMRVINVTEGVDGARNTKEGQELIRNLLQAGWTVLVGSYETTPILQYQLNLAAPGSEQVFDWLSESGFCFRPVRLPYSEAA